MEEVGRGHEGIDGVPVRRASKDELHPALEVLMELLSLSREQPRPKATRSRNAGSSRIHPITTPESQAVIGVNVDVALICSALEHDSISPKSSYAFQCHWDWFMNPSSKVRSSKFCMKFRLRPPPPARLPLRLALPALPSGRPSGGGG